ncbi:DSC E3 ubiquitin ligase complex subunit 4 [Erysiphe necator]|nr:DSC E3 ubiquitin ligase complex subunit 4 [Erysiphe necator]
MENVSPSANPYRNEDIAQESIQNTSSLLNLEYGRSQAQKRALARLKKKSEFLLNLITNLDTLIYVEFCIIYYMDCSLFRLVLRLLNQMIFFTPKPAFIRPAPQQRPYIGAIFIPGVTCMLLHIFTARSEASEAMRGYLHGGVIIDLIGQKGPTSKVHLILLDILLLVLQCFMLSVRVEEDRLQTILTVLSRSSSKMADLTLIQDYDAEERGIIRDEIVAGNNLELEQIAGPSSSNSHDQEISNMEIESESESTSQLTQEDDEALELFWSGMASVCDFHILHNLKKQWRDYGNATGSALQTVGYSAELAAITANRRISAATTQLQQGVS